MRYIDQKRMELGLLPIAPKQREPKPPKARQPRPHLRDYFREYQRNRRQTAAGRRAVAASNLKATHGLTLEQYAELLQKQAHQCAICCRPIIGAYDPGRPSTGKRGPAPGGAHVDHDHACCPGRTSCGRCVRGLLCDACNHGLYRFRDNAAVLRAAADYLERRRDG